MQTQSERARRRRQVVPARDLVQLRFGLQRAHIAAARDLAALEELAVASEDDAALFAGKAADFAVLQAVMEKRVVTQHAQKTRQAAEVRVRQEQTGLFLLSRAYFYQVAVADHALQGRRLAVDGHRADLGVRHAERLDRVLQARGASAARLEGNIPLKAREKFAQRPVELKTRDRHYSSSMERGQLFLRRRDSARSASSLPPVWQRAQQLVSSSA